MSQNELQRVVAELDELIARDEEQQDYCSETGPNEAMRRVVALIGIRRRLIAEASRIEAAQAVAPGVLSGWYFERVRDMGRGDERHIAAPSGNAITVADRGSLAERILFELATAMLAAAPASEAVCQTCAGHGMIGYTTGQTPEQFEQHEAPCPDCNEPDDAEQEQAGEMPELPEPQAEVSVAGYNDGLLRPALEDYFTADQMHAFYRKGYDAALLRRAARVEVTDAMVDRVVEVLIPPGATRIRICEAYNLARRVIAAALEPKK